MTTYTSQDNKYILSNLKQLLVLKRDRRCEVPSNIQDQVENQLIKLITSGDLICQCEPGKEPLFIKTI